MRDALRSLGEAQHEVVALAAGQARAQTADGLDGAGHRARSGDAANSPGKQVPRQVVVPARRPGPATSSARGFVGVDDIVAVLGDVLEHLRERVGREHIAGVGERNQLGGERGE